MRELGRAFLPALIIALIVGAGVFAFREYGTEKQYAASVVTEIRATGEVIPGDAFIEQLRAPFIGLAADNDVLDQVLSQVDTGWDAGELASHLELAPGTSPALLTFTVTADSPELALEVARTTVTTVSQASSANAARNAQGQLEQVQASIAAEEARNSQLIPGDPARSASDQSLADLRDQLTQLQSTGGGNQLVVLAVPEQSTAPVSPMPASEASVAGLVAFIVAAELIVLLRSRLGRRPRPAWARRVARKYQADFDPKVTTGLPPIVAATVAASDRGASSSNGNGSNGNGTRSAGARHAAHGRIEQNVLVLVGDDAVYPAPTSLSTGGQPRHPDALVGADLTSEWWTFVDVHDVETAVVLLSSGGRDRRAAEGVLKQLRTFGIHTHLVVQPSGRKRRSDPAPGGRTASQRPEEQVGHNARH
ncbi:hypothetical protein HQ305_04535 [Rhodococcus sp. BP-149]|uniref:hypothetical protein n=1 Tax=unclassified Rhodococcus (in: high G+C Gram-positive bacteria) TaxID=192944 RepID=UPI001C9B0BE9|nr:MULTISPECIES: hypothetical protein [unclassified Rhodococcus (in: high G+C Gram-positive bacteria)]MBY6684433.1 hypothetical protein [Rhodococcus sp. BP-288]MBY6692906.1 hypothetical protein [Rhodococcus sp. BP-188]MBY6697103.1 hypothetical protein [Rhodococcus sp. BP-285]MBY6701780.1 hypothetical protein [Rhodococcus sp. BP-283]MBY6710287.1 hypothetical protein [Rhodococcus sp. BP-160]